MKESDIITEDTFTAILETGTKQDVREHPHVSGQHVRNPGCSGPWRLALVPWPRASVSSEAHPSTTITSKNAGVVDHITWLEDGILPSMKYLQFVPRDLNL